MDDNGCGRDIGRQFMVCGAQSRCCRSYPRRAQDQHHVTLIITSGGGLETISETLGTALA